MSATRRRMLNRQPIRRGDIRIAKPLFGLEGEPREVLVLRVGTETPEFAEIMLTHRDPAISISTDKALHPQDADSRYPIMAHTQLRGVVWIHQLTSLVTYIPEYRVNNVEVLQHTDKTPEHDWLSYSVPTESQARFLSTELDALWALTGDCTYALLDDRAPWRLDTDVMSPKWIEQSPSKEIICAEVQHILHTRTITADTDDLAALHQSGALDIARWEDIFPNLALGHAIVNSFAHLISSAVRTTHEFTTECDLEYQIDMPDRHEGTRPLSVAPNTRLITAPFLWQGDAETLADDLSGILKAESAECDIMMIAASDG